MDMINRYVYAVTKGLPKKQREDIEKELTTLIDDMVEQNQEQEGYESKIQKVLLELGDPEVLADNYRGSKRYLIGPQYYDKYLLVMKIVFGAVFTGISIAVLIGSIFSKQLDISAFISDYFASLFSALFQAFAWTTIAFVIAERKSMDAKQETSGKNKWSPSQLPTIPEKKAVIPIAEPIISIFFTTIFIAIIYSAPKLFAAYIQNDNGVTVIPVFNLEVIQGYRAIFVGIFIVCILKDVLKLYFRRWTLKLSGILAVLSIVSTVLTLVIFTNTSVWNVNFADDIVKHMHLTFDFVNLWARLKIGLIVVVILGSAIDIVTTVYKGFRYNMQQYR